LRSLVPLSLRVKEKLRRCHREYEPCRVGDPEKLTTRKRENKSANQIFGIFLREISDLKKEPVKKNILEKKVFFQKYRFLWFRRAKYNLQFVHRFW